MAYLYLKHRQSNDLDFFTPVEEIIDPFSHQLEKHLTAKGFECKRQRAFHSFVELVVLAKIDLTPSMLIKDELNCRFEV